MKQWGLIFILVSQLAFAQEPEPELTLEEPPAPLTNPVPIAAPIPSPEGPASSTVVPVAPVTAPPAEMPVAPVVTQPQGLPATYRSMIPPELPGAKPVPLKRGVKNRGLQVGLGISYSLNARAKFDPVKFPENPVITEESTANFRFKNVMSYELEVRHLNENSFGFILGTTIDQKRALEHGFLHGSTLVWDFIDGMWTIDLNVTTYHLSGAYRLENFFFSGGVNYCSVKVSSPPQNFNDPVTTPTIGWQAALGYYITDYLIFEFGTRQVNFSMVTNYDDGTTIDFGKGGFSNSWGSLKIIY